MPNDQSQTSEMTDHPSPAMPATRSGIDASNPAMERWVQAQSALLNGTIDVANTMHAFSQSRLRANFDVWKSLMACRDTAELVALQRAYVENTAVQYSDHARGLSEQIQHFVGDMTPGSNDSRKL